MTTIERVSTSPAALGECPVWSSEEQCLYWEDIDGRAIHRFDPSTGDVDTRHLEGRPGAFVLTPEAGRLVVATEHQLVALDWASGETSPMSELEPAGTGNRLNDGRCDPAGRFVVGSMYEDTKAGRHSGILHRVHSDGSVDELRRGIGVSNGLGFDPDRGRMYFADTPTEQVLVWDYDLDDGSRRNGRVFLDYRDLEGKPDGACVDADGCYWSASVYGWAVIRVTPDGAVDRRIEVPVEKPTMPAFGGSDLKTLFVTSIGSGSSGSRDGFEAGDTLAIDLDVAGRPEPLFV